MQVKVSVEVDGHTTWSQPAEYSREDTDQALEKTIADFVQFNSVRGDGDPAAERGHCIVPRVDGWGPYEGN